MKSRMIETGIRKNVSDYLTALNISLVKLREEDLIEEPHRKVLFNFEGSINKKLPSEVQRYLEVHKSKAVEKLVKEGYSRPK